MIPQKLLDEYVDLKNRIDCDKTLVAIYRESKKFADNKYDVEKKHWKYVYLARFIELSKQYLFTVQSEEAINQTPHKTADLPQNLTNYAEM